MPDFLIVALLFAVYFAVMRWLLPWLGVPT
jgi:hypothetical protein